MTRTGEFSEFREDPDQLQELQKKYPLKKPAYWSMFNEAPTIKLHKKAVGTVVDWYLYSAGSPHDTSEWRNIVCHPPKGKAHHATKCPFDELANVMYHLYLVGAWNEGN